MCMEDVWIGLHTIVKKIGTGSTVTIPPNISRIGLISSGIASGSWSDNNFNTLATWQRGYSVFDYTTSVTTAVPPGVDTGTITASTFDKIVVPQFFKIQDWGAVVTEKSFMAYSGGSHTVWEMVPDAVLLQFLSRYGDERFGKFVDLNPQIKGA